MTDKEAMDMILAHAVPGAPPYVPVMDRGSQDTAYSEMLRLLDLSTQQAAEIERLRAALTDEQLCGKWEETFSTRNPFCPCDLRTFTKVARAIERAHGIGA